MPPERPLPFIVGIGASAGGLEALQRVFECVRPGGRAAFVVIQHLSPDFKSLMDELLARHTTLAIHRAETGMAVEPDAVYLLPPGKEMIVANGALVLRDRGPSQALSLPIDVFLASLAEDAGARAVAVILSGTGSDGSRGIRAIHEAGGLVIAQDEDSAKFDGMPRAAIDTGVVDLVLAPEEIAGALERYFERGAREQEGVAAAIASGDDTMRRLFDLLRRESGIDFSGYKPATVTRRVERRITLSETLSLEEYLGRVETDPAELRQLYRDLLIGVTRFFRDPDAFDVIRRIVLPQLAERVVPGDELRLWVPACATGEEAYGLAILAHEALREAGRPPHVKVFATDVHRASLEVASAGGYDAEALAPVPADLRERWFQPREGKLQVTTELRNSLVFAAHNLLRDAPFTRVDLISCRNLLIYLKAPAQRKILSLFHFALKPQGVLFLGPSESPGALAEEFEPVDVHWKVFRKKRDVRLAAELPHSPSELERRARGTVPLEEPRVRVAREALLRRYAPPSIAVDAALHVLHAFNGAGRFLVQRDGKPSLHLLELLAGELRFVVAAGVKRVQKDGEPVTFAAVQVASAAGPERVRVTVTPAHPGNPEGILLVTFEPDPEAAAGAPAGAVEVEAVARERIGALEHELRAARENLQATVEEMESSNEELQATNEELIASNEELQSTNEELHSVNEELYTVNAEHQAKIAELTELTADMNHLLEATQVHTLFLDRDLRIRRFTPKLAELFHLLPQDVGRPIEGFAHALEHAGLAEDLRAVLATGKPVERDVTDQAKRAFLLRILPYRPRAEVEGVVATLVDVTLLERARREVARSAERYRTLLGTMSSVVWTAGPTGRFETPQPEWEAYTGQGPRAHAGEGWLDAFHADDVAGVRTAWGRGVERGEPWSAEGRLWHAASREHRWFTLRAAPVREGGEIREWVGNIVDVDDARRADAALREKTAQLAGILENSPAAIWVKDLAGRYVLASRAAARLLGGSAPELVGRSDHDLLPRERADAARTAEQEVVSTGAAVTTEDVRRADDGERTLQVVRFPLRDGAGRIVAVAGIGTDVTDRKLAELESREGIQRRDQLLAMLSHELRTPLGAVIHASELLERQGPPAGSRRAVHVIRRQARHMSRLIEDLLDVSRIAHRQLVLDRRGLDLAAIVREAVEAAQGGAEKKRLRLALTVPEAPVVVVGDPVRLAQVVTNLIANGVKYTERGAVEVAVEVAGETARVRVKDSGIGLSPEELRHVFDMFYQAAPSLDRTAGGLGVGLTLARTLAQLHGGELSAASEGKGKGAEFVLALPRAGADVLEEPQKVRSGRLRIAVVEDNEDIRSTMRDLLELNGHEVVEAPDGVRGVELIVGSSPDVAFVDVGLPGLTGHQVAQNVRRQLGNQVRLVALTGYGSAEDRAAALAAGFDDHMVKPVESEHLEHALLGAAPRARQRPTTQS